MSGENRVLKSRGLVVVEEAVPVPVGEVIDRRARPSDLDGAPEISIERGEDGSIRTISVRCGCGRVTTLQCEYSDRGDEDERQDA